MSGTQNIEWKDWMEMSRELNLKGFGKHFRILDAYTIIHTMRGNRIFPFSILEMRKELGSSKENGVYMQIYIFTTHDLENGYLMYPAGTHEADLCESYFQKCRPSGQNRESF